eukprot:gnl/Trimastix_PCT/789.p1 GENE.gnl/Trimastix_PCT/789~~gnl/Trimastix_PCT/789.p1  ORF type:complete len:505 (-),score=195.44 gnl/Trimastix_PCT/789:153-1625(-)
MEENYDAIILGTGLTECIISGLLSIRGLKVLHMDRNDYYGGACASLNLKQLFEQFVGSDAPIPDSLGASRDYNVDLIPKFLMSQGALVKMLIHTEVTRYIEFQKVKGSFVFKKGKIQKVPATESEALTTKLVKFWEKNKLRKLLNFIANYDISNPKTTQGMDINVVTTRFMFNKFGFSPDSVDFIGHAMALFTNDDYLDRPAIETVDRMKLYGESLAAHGDSPYIYPMYGLSELPQGFARLAAIFGGTYMLRKPLDEVIYNEEGQAVGVRSEGEIARARYIVGDPSYFPDRVRSVGRVVRCIAILNHPIDNTKNADSTQIIIPQRQVNRRNDIFITCLSHVHCICPRGKFIAFLSTEVETDTPERELDPALRLIHPVEQTFYSVHDMLEPNDDGQQSKIFISKSYDAAGHFETTSKDVFRLFTAITGQQLDLSSRPRSEAEAAAQQAVEEAQAEQTTTTTTTGGDAPAPPPPAPEGAPAEQPEGGEHPLA